MMEYGAQTIPAYATEIADWLDDLASASGDDRGTLRNAYRYAADHIRQDVPALRRDEARRRGQ